MPTVHRARGFKFVIYLNDHPPPHVHVWHAGTVAKIDIGDRDRPPGVIDPGIMDAPRLREAVRIAEEQQERLLEAWRQCHGP